MSAAEPPIVVTRDDRPLPAGCSPREVATFVVRFFANFNRGKVRPLRRMFAPPRTTDDMGRDARDGRLGFWWYSASSPGKHFVARDRRSLFRLFRARHRRHERLRLVMVDVAPGWVRGAVGLSFVIVRTADDLRLAPGEEAFALGKAGMNCSPKGIHLWSMSGPPDHALWGCPLPLGWTPGSAVVACTRGG